MTAVYLWSGEADKHEVQKNLLPNLNISGDAIIVQEDLDEAAEFNL